MKKKRQVRTLDHVRDVSLLCKLVVEKFSCVKYTSVFNLLYITGTLCIFVVGV